MAEYKFWQPKIEDILQRGFGGERRHFFFFFYKGFPRRTLALALLPNPKWWTLGVGIFNYAEMLKGYSMPEMLAAAVLGIVPSLIAFILCQKALFSVSLSGAVKG